MLTLSDLKPQMKLNSLHFIIPKEYIDSVNQICNGKLTILEQFTSKVLSTEIPMQFAQRVNVPNINSGSDTYVTFTGKATLMHAIMYSIKIKYSEEYINHLISKKINFNENSIFEGYTNICDKPHDGTLLHIFIQIHNNAPNFNNIVKKMIEAGADPMKKNSRGITANDFLEQHKKTLFLKENWKQYTLAVTGGILGNLIMYQLYKKLNKRIVEYFKVNKNITHLLLCSQIVTTFVIVSSAIILLYNALIEKVMNKNLLTS